MITPNEHPELEMMTIMYCDVMEVDCFFEPTSQNLHFVYIGGIECNDMLRDSVIQALEREYQIAYRAEVEEQKLSSALDRYYQKTGISL